MIYLNLSESKVLENNIELSVQVDNTFVNFGLVPREVVKEILEELQGSLDEALALLKS